MLSKPIGNDPPIPKSSEVFNSPEIPQVNGVLDSVEKDYNDSGNFLDAEIEQLRIEDY